MSKIKNISEVSGNASGIRGVYVDNWTGKYMARIRIRGKLYNLGIYTDLGDAAKARKRGEEELFDAFLEFLKENPVRFGFW